MLAPDEDPEHAMTLLIRFEDENDPDQIHYEAWGQTDENSEKPDRLMVYLSNRLDQESIAHSWKYFKRLWCDPKYLKAQTKGETIH